MAVSVAAKRYAQAVFELAVEQKDEDHWKEELANMAEVLGDHEFRSILESPRVEFSDKQEMLREGLEGLRTKALNLAYLLTSKGQIALLEQISAQYSSLLDEHRGIEHVEVATVLPLAKDELEYLADKLGQATGKRVILEPKVDQSIIGGMVVRWGDKLIDGSVRTRLNKLKRELTNTRAESVA